MRANGFFEGAFKKKPNGPFQSTVDVFRKNFFFFFFVFSLNTINGYGFLFFIRPRGWEALGNKVKFFIGTGLSFFLGGGLALRDFFGLFHAVFWQNLIFEENGPLGFKVLKLGGAFSVKAKGGMLRGIILVCSLATTFGFLEEFSDFNYFWEKTNF